MEEDGFSLIDKFSKVVLSSSALQLLSSSAPQLLGSSAPRLLGSFCLRICWGGSFFGAMDSLNTGDELILA